MAVDALEIFDELVECEVGVIVPHIKTILEFCLHVRIILVVLSVFQFICGFQVGANKQLGSKVRVKALSFISWITRLKKKVNIALNFLTSEQYELCLFIFSPS
jgi:hypothetical protein